MRKLAVYGTLREGSYNYGRFPNVNKIKTTKISGFQLTCKPGFTGFPYLRKMDGSEVVIDILEASDESAKFIDRMEIGAHYKPQMITVDGDECTIYLADPSRVDIDNLTPIGDDWIEFEKQRRH